MDLVNIEGSRAVSLVFLKANKGAPFSLDMLNAVVSRYSFQHYPDKVPPPGSDNPKLLSGNFGGVQIDELAAYNDGIIAAARADTEVLDAFLDDLYGFLAEQYSVERSSPETRYYESSLIVTMDEKVGRKFDFLEGLYHDLAGFESQYGHESMGFSFGGFRAEGDVIQSRSSTPKFTFERRIRVPYSTNQWFSNAMLRTKDHLAVLANLEKQLLR